MSQIVHPVILCGGTGTRLWPLSTPEMPKQFLALTSSKSMLEETADRVGTSLNPSISFARPLVIGSRTHAELLNTALPNARKIFEPCGRNSAPAVAAACLSFEPEDLILILPADHDIQDVAAFHNAIFAAATAAQRDAILTFGIQPSHPATQYGYIKAASNNGVNTPVAVRSFVEKPELELAKSYLANGSYFWNAGIFLFKARVMLEALETYAPDVLAGVCAAMPDVLSENVYLNDEEFKATPSISIDYAVMEKATNIKTVPVSMGWSDVGGFQALHELLTRSDRENSLHGPVVANDSEGLYVRSEGPTVTVNSVSNLVIVATPDDILITPLNRSCPPKALAMKARTLPQKLDLSQDLIDESKNWLWNTLDVWTSIGWNDKRNGFVEQMTLAGRPILDTPQSVGGQAQQVYSFAKAIEMGWPAPDKAHSMVNRGIANLDLWKREPDGGFAHAVDHNCASINHRRDLSDHSYIILAGVAAFQSTGEKAALRIADDAVTFVDTALKDNKHGGWFEAWPALHTRTANSHLLLLKAMLAYHNATRCKQSLAGATEIVRLFETRYFNPGTNAVAECFRHDWMLKCPESKTIIEPGHNYEWATLLCEYDRISGHDSVSWQRRLIKCANGLGRNAHTGFAVNRALADGTASNPNSKLAQQLSMLQAWACHPESSVESDHQNLFTQVLHIFLKRGPKGGWIDQVDPENTPVSTHVSAATLNHVVTAFSQLLPDSVG